jgi:hypothetical protein
MSLRDSARAPASRPPSELSATPKPNPGRRAHPGVMSSRIRRIVVFVGATGVLAAAAGCGGTVATSSSSGAQAASQPSGQQQRPGAGPRDLSALAAKLGVSSARLQEAIQATRPSSPGAGAPNATDRAAALAKALGLPEAKVRAAMQAVGPGGAPQGPPPSTQSQQPPAGQSAA